MHHLQISRIYEKLIDILVNTCYNKITVKASTTDNKTKGKNKLNKQRVQNIFDTIAVGVSDYLYKNSHALRLNCNTFIQKSQQYYAKKKVIF